MQIKPHNIHVWSASLLITEETVIIYQKLLSNEELARANRFRFDKHRRRFIAAHGVLRKLLSQYLFCDPETISFQYNEHHKPYLANNPLRFNLSHSDDQALFAFTNDAEIGVDIEKIEPKETNAIANRYFNQQECNALNALPKDKQALAFYQLWTRKEALLKAVGKGLSLPLNQFAVNLEGTETIILENNHWTLKSLEIQPGFAAALASNQTIETIIYSIF